MQPPPPPISSWVLPGQALLGWDRRMQKVGDQGGLVTGVLFFMFPEDTWTHTAMPLCAEAFTVVQRCRSTCLCPGALPSVCRCVT